LPSSRRGVRLVVHPEARQELRAAAIWYDDQRDGLGDDLIREVDRGIGTVLEQPTSSPLWPGVPEREIPIRKFMIDRFPYSIAFEAHPDRLVILAFAHAKRRPLTLR
jgi:toxin ParE1/3/4